MVVVVGRGQGGGCFTQSGTSKSNGGSRTTPKFERREGGGGGWPQNSGIMEFVFVVRLQQAMKTRIPKTVACDSQVITVFF